MVESVAMGSFGRVKKNNERAITPNTPRKIKYFVLFPNGEILARNTTPRLKINETILLNNMSSVTGKPVSSFTQTCISENANAEINMYCTALFKLANHKRAKFTQILKQVW